MIIQGYSPINEAKATNKRNPRQAILAIAKKEGYSVDISSERVTLIRRTSTSQFAVDYSTEFSGNASWKILVMSGEYSKSIDSFLEYVDNFKRSIRVAKALSLILNVDEAMNPESRLYEEKADSVLKFKGYQLGKWDPKLENLIPDSSTLEKLLDVSVTSRNDLKFPIGSSYVLIQTEPKDDTIDIKNFTIV